MDDPFRKVKPGEDIEFRAPAWNAILDAGRAVSELHLGDTDAWIDDPFLGDQILIRNDSGGPLGRYAVVGLNGVLISPSVNLDAFLNGPIAFSGVIPDTTHFGRFAILLEPAVEGAVVRAQAAGVCVAEIEINDDLDTCADATPGRTDLLSDQTGSAKILWRQSDDPYSGYEAGGWGLIRFANYRPREIEPPPVECQLRRENGTQTACNIPATNLTMHYYLETDTDFDGIPDIIIDYTVALVYNPVPVVVEWKSEPYEVPVVGGWIVWRLRCLTAGPSKRITLDRASAATEAGPFTSFGETNDIWDNDSTCSPFYVHQLDFAGTRLREVYQ